MSKFEIIRRSAAARISIVIAAACKRGVFFMRDTTNNDDGRPAALLADGKALGCATREVTADGPATLDRAGVFPGRLELPDKAGYECSLDPLPDAYEAEGDDYIVKSGTGSIDANTAIGTKLSWKDGKTRVAQTNDIAEYVLAGKPLPETANDVRIYAEKIAGGVQ